MKLPCAIVWIAFSIESAGRPPDPRPKSDKPPLQPLVQQLVVDIFSGGQKSRLRLDGSVMTLASTTAEPERSRVLTPDERQPLVAAASAVPLGDHRRSCGAGEIFLSVNLDGKTGWYALCPEPSPQDGPWRQLLERVRSLARK